MKNLKDTFSAKSTTNLDEHGVEAEMRCPAVEAFSQRICVKCPAKINLTLEILNKRPDGFHDIQSVMQTINLFDFITIEVVESQNMEINLSGTSDEIPYDERNLVHKAIMLFWEKTKLQPKKFFIHIEKNIPISAGLAGGSTDAAGTIWGLNKLFNNILSSEDLHALCAKLGSDLNFCLEGGCQLTTGRGEILEKLPFCEFELSLIKPKNLGISAKEAYTKFSALENKPNLNMTEKLVASLNAGNCNVENFLHNDLESAVFDDYNELQQIKKDYPKSIMSGSGSTYFILGRHEISPENNDFWVKTNLSSINYGVTEAI